MLLVQHSTNFRHKLESAAKPMGNSHLIAGSKRGQTPNSYFPSDIKLIGEARFYLNIQTADYTFSRVNGKKMSVILGFLGNNGPGCNTVSSAPFFYLNALR